MFSLVQTASGALRATARACACRTAPASLPSSSSRLISTASFSSSLRPTAATSPVLRALQQQPRTAFASSPVATPLAQPQATQVRTFKMPSCMRKKKSALSRSGGQGKTARRNGAKKAKRVRMRIKKIN
ncbi:hypothetical protein JCM10213_005726 [Rhodosporidiobolus nylandii]